MLDIFAKRVLEAALFWELIDRMPSGKVESGEIGGLVLDMVHGAVMQERAQIEAEELFIIGQDISLQQHFSEDIMQALHGPAAEFITKMCRPLIIPAERLMFLDQWDDWKMLEGYLTTQNFGPLLTFKNTPVRVKDLKGPGYVCDIRILPFQGQFVWLP